MKNGLEKLRRLMRGGKYDAALREVELLLTTSPLAANLWVLRRDLIQLIESGKIEDAEVSYKKALAIDPENLEALESMAHFYDAVVVPPAKAKVFAGRYVRNAKIGLRRVEKIISTE